MKKLINRKSTLLALVIFLASSASFGVVCRKPGVNGYDTSAERAHLVLPSNTGDPRKTVIYVEKTARGLYFHSNFITPGFENPTKIANERISDLQEAFFNIRFSSAEDLADGRLVAEETFRESVQFLLDKSVFDALGHPLVDVKDATNISVVDGDRGEVLITSPEVVERSAPPPVLVSKVQGCCLYGIPPHLAPKIHEALQQRPFAKENVRFLSFIRDSGTEKAIGRTTNLKGLRLGEAGTRIESLSQIEEAFQNAAGKTVVMISHVEADKFVMRDAAQNVVASIPIADVRTLAARYNIELVDLGCQTAKQIVGDSLGFGVMTKFNTVTAVESVERALAGSRNYSEFFDNLTSQNLKIVIDRGFIRDWPLCADVYGKANSVPIWVKLARVFISFRKS